MALSVLSSRVKQKLWSLLRKLRHKMRNAVTNGISSVSRWILPREKTQPGADTLVEFTAFLCNRAGISQVVDVGAGLSTVYDPVTKQRGLQVVAVDSWLHLALAWLRHPGIKTRLCPLAKGLPDLAPMLGQNNLLVWTGDSAPNQALLQSIGRQHRGFPFCILSWPGSGLTHPDAVSADMLAGSTRVKADGTQINVVLGGALARPPSGDAGKKAKVLAIMNTYNDLDIVEATVRHLFKQGVDVWIVDNWSTDGTFELLEEWQKNHGGIAGLERFPAAGPEEQFLLHSLLKQKEEVARQNPGYDWLIHYDSDEIRESPWPDVTLAEAFRFVEKMGYNAVDHTVVEFRPVADGYDRGTSPTEFFRFFEFGKQLSDTCQIKAWKNTAGQRVDMASSAGHDVRFEGRRVFPLKFLLRHYSLRSAAQARKKLFKERLNRVTVEKKTRNWNSHYDRFTGMENEEILWQRAALIPFDPAKFHSDFLLQRLSGMNIPVSK